MASPVTIAVGTGQVVQLHAGGRIVGAAVRGGRGWSLTSGGRTYQVATLDAALEVLGLLPDHHAHGRRP